MNRVGNGRRRRHDRHFADAAHAVGMTRVRHFHQDRVDHRQVQARRHSVIEEAGIGHFALAVIDVLLIERPADALHAAALHLPFDIAGVNRLADILDRGVTQDRNFTGLRVHLNIDDVRGKGAAPSLVRAA